MIASLEGVVASISTSDLVLEVGGIGYRVYAGPGTLASARVGERLKLHTHHLVREDSQALYGFRSTEELAFFELITTVSGVGPKVGLAIVSSRPVPDLELAILQGDDAVLTAVSGVGKRLAGRIVLELKEKVSAAGAEAGVGRRGGQRGRGPRCARGARLQPARGARGGTGVDRVARSRGVARGSRQGGAPRDASRAGSGLTGVSGRQVSRRRARSEFRSILPRAMPWDARRSADDRRFELPRIVHYSGERNGPRLSGERRRHSRPWLQGLAASVAVPRQ